MRKTKVKNRSHGPSHDIHHLVRRGVLEPFGRRERTEDEEDPCGRGGGGGSCCEVEETGGFTYSQHFFHKVSPVDGVVL